MDTVSRFEEAFGQPFALSDSLPDLAELPSDGPTVLIFSPHPDDECVVGLLPLIWRRELHARVVNVSVTLGSDATRREARRKELSQACRVLGFEQEELAYEGVVEETRDQRPILWHRWVSEVKTLIERYDADALVFPHDADHHPTHIGTHRVVMDAYTRLGTKPACLFTEFWRAMKAPNLMVEASSENLGILLKALVCHEGEVERNPYHLRLPAWMIDNTRRGAELIGGMGKNAPGFIFSTLYEFMPSDQGADLIAQLSPDSCFRG